MRVEQAKDIYQDPSNWRSNFLCLLHFKAEVIVIYEYVKIITGIYNIYKIRLWLIP